MSSPAPNSKRNAAHRTSLNGRRSLQGGSSGLPRPATSMSTSRNTTTQPTYDFITGAEVEESALPLRRTKLRQSSIHKQPDAVQDENLRARLNSLEYELKNLQQERHLLALQHDKELRDLQVKADTDFRKYQTSESASQKATHRYDALQREFREAQDQSVNEKAAFDRKLRNLQEENNSLKEDADDAQARLTDQERHYKYQLDDVEAKRAALQETVESTRRDMDQLAHEFESSTSRLSQKDNEVAVLQAQVIELKSQSADVEALSVLQSQLSDQVNHIRQLESTNREQLIELRKLRDAHRSVQVVEEQKRGLETELRVLKDIERQLSEAQIQKEILQDERRTWTSLLQKDGRETEFESPEAVVKALVQERIEHASFIDRLGTIETELSEKDEVIRTLDNEKSALKTELEKAHSTQQVAPEGIDTKAYRRLDRQRTLAVKEVEYLRAQLKTFDTEETVMMDNQKFDAQRAEQVKQLEVLVDQYRGEIASLHTDLSNLESAPPATPTENRGTKRSAPLDEADQDTSSQVGPLLRKNKNLQVALQKTAQQSQLLATELQAAKSQLKSLRESSKTRILELRDNPTVQAETIKLNTLQTLKQENQELLAQLRGDDLKNTKLVSVSTVDALNLDLQDMERAVADKEKRMRRQREIWTEKAAEFRDVIASILGWKITFLPNGKAKVSSMFYGKRHEVGDDSDDEDEHYIIFDGEKGTMKISGGTEGSFGREVQDLVNFWVKEKKEIPGFLAAMTLEFHEKYGSGDDRLPHNSA